MASTFYLDAYVHTLGDSTLDNYWWELKDNSSNKKDADQKCVEGQLQTKLGDWYKVVSHAYEGFTTKSVLEGDEIGRVLPGFQYDGTKEAYKKRKMGNSTERFIKPLDHLKNRLQEILERFYAPIFAKA